MEEHWCKENKYYHKIEKGEIYNTWWLDYDVTLIYYCPYCGKKLI